MSVTPPRLSDEKNPGPTCKPIENTNSIRPNSLMKWSVAASKPMLKWPAAMPVNNIHVTPIETPLILILLSAMPAAMTIASTKTVWAIIAPDERCSPPSTISLNH